MHDRDQFHATLLRRLGGKARVAEALGLDRGSVTRWHERGIPAKYWHQIVRFGASLPEPVVVSADELAATKPDTVPV
jgi:hypothetical protein